VLWGWEKKGGNRYTRENEELADKCPYRGKKPGGVKKGEWERKLLGGEKYGKKKAPSSTLGKNWEEVKRKYWGTNQANPLTSRVSLDPPRATARGKRASQRRGLVENKGGKKGRSQGGI